MTDCISEHGAGHSDCPKCWYRSPRNPNAVVPTETLVSVDLVLRDGAGDAYVLIPGGMYAELPDVQRGMKYAHRYALRRDEICEPVTVEHSIKIRGEVVE